MITFRKFRAEEVALTHPRLAPGVGPLTFVHLSDLHLRRWGPQHEELSGLLRERPAHLILFTGDAFTGRRRSAECAARLFSGLRAECGVYAVRGNWDVVYGPPLRQMRSMMADWGTRLLVNEGLTVQTAAGPVRVAGLDDPHTGAPDVARTLASADEAPALSILLSHGAVAADLLPPGHGVDLLLCGHTHGGQVRVPFWRRLPYRFYGGMTHGLYQVGPMKLYVNRGFGAVGKVPLRLACPAEVAFFTINATGPMGTSTSQAGEGGG